MTGNAVPRELFSNVSPKGQVTIPAELRRLLGVKPKDRVAFRVVKGQVQLRRARSVLDELYQSVPALGRRRSWKDVEEIAREEQAQRAAGRSAGRPRGGGDADAAVRPTLGAG